MKTARAAAALLNLCLALSPAVWAAGPARPASDGAGTPGVPGKSASVPEKSPASAGGARPDRSRGAAADGATAGRTSRARTGGTAARGASRWASRPKAETGRAARSAAAAKAPAPGGAGSPAKTAQKARTPKAPAAAKPGAGKDAKSPANAKAQAAANAKAQAAANAQPQAAANAPAAANPKTALRGAAAPGGASSVLADSAAASQAAAAVSGAPSAPGAVPSAVPAAAAATSASNGVPAAATAAPSSAGAPGAPLPALPAVAVGPPPVPQPARDAIDWNVLAAVDPAERDLVVRYAAASKEVDRLSFDLARRFAPDPLEIQFRSDLSRLRWRRTSELSAVWIEAVVCPADRAQLARVDGAVTSFSAGEEWKPLAIRGDKLIAPAAWGRRAVLARPDGALVRLLKVE